LDFLFLSSFFFFFIFFFICYLFSFFLYNMIRLNYNATTIGTFINKVGARIDTTNSFIIGLAVEFSDGTRRVDDRFNNDINNPYLPDTDVYTSNWVSMPDGFNALTSVISYNNGSNTLIRLEFYMNGSNVGVIDTGNSLVAGITRMENGSSLPTVNMTLSYLTVRVPLQMYPILISAVYDSSAVLPDGKWSDFVITKNCTAACGEDTIIYTRTCILPPDGRANPCIGDATKTESCNLAPCKPISTTDDPASDPATASSTVSGGQAATNLPPDSTSTPITPAPTSMHLPNIYLLLFIAFIFVCLMYSYFDYEQVAIPNTSILLNN
jgi:hypothetical protein